jgi:hypothetical protein
VNPVTTGVFDLPDRLAAKADPALIAGDQEHFAAIAESLERSIAELSDRLDAERKARGGARAAPHSRRPRPADQLRWRCSTRPTRLPSGSWTNAIHSSVPAGPSVASSWLKITCGSDSTVAPPARSRSTAASMSGTG